LNSAGSILSVESNLNVESNMKMWSPRLQNVESKIAFYFKKSVILNVNSSHSIQSSSIVLRIVAITSTTVLRCKLTR